MPKKKNQSVIFQNNNIKINEGFKKEEEIILLINELTALKLLIFFKA